MTTPVIGAIMNFLIFRVFFRKKANWQLIRAGMADGMGSANG